MCWLPLRAMLQPLFSTRVPAPSLATRMEAPSVTAMPLVARLTAALFEMVTEPFTSWTVPTGAWALAEKAKPVATARKANFFMTCSFLVLVESEQKIRSRRGRTVERPHAARAYAAEYRPVRGAFLPARSK